MLSHILKNVMNLKRVEIAKDLLCGLVVRVPGYRFRGPGSISGATDFFEK
jgi:hypothetical protein